MRLQRHLVTALIAFVAAIAGVLLGRQLVEPTPPPGAELHAVLHEQLSLDPAQDKALHALEASFEIRRREIERELRAENARLADAIAAEHGNGPRVTAAVHASHTAMGALQNETLAHIFAMRQILRPDQASTFDRAVTRALTDETR